MSEQPFSPNTLAERWGCTARHDRGQQRRQAARGGDDLAAHTINRR